MEQNSFLTVEQVAERLCVSIPTIHRLLKEKRIDAHRVGVQWRFTEAQIEAFLDENRNLNEDTDE